MRYKIVVLDENPKPTFSDMKKLQKATQKMSSKYAYLRNFQFDNFPKSKIDSKNSFEMRMSIFLF